MSEIAKTGFWNGETAHNHHVHSEQLSAWVCNFAKQNKLINVTDFGCGLGRYLDSLKAIGVNGIGVEGDVPKGAIFFDIVEYDLTFDLTNELGLKSQLVLSLEVGEHIPKEHMTTYIDNITYHCEKYLITSWAVRGQEGFGHVNCLDNHEIIPEFEKRGFELMEKETEDARSVIEDKCWWFKKTILIFKKI